MCLCVNGETRRPRFSCLSFHVYLMKGEYDDKLSWPFFGSVVVQLVNQNPGWDHDEITVRFRNDPKLSLNHGRVTSGDIAVNGCCANCYISQGHVEDHYLKNDCLKFRVVGVELCFENPKFED